MSVPKSITKETALRKSICIYVSSVGQQRNTSLFHVCNIFYRRNYIKMCFSNFRRAQTQPPFQKAFRTRVVVPVQCTVQQASLTLQHFPRRVKNDFSSTLQNILAQKKTFNIVVVLEFIQFCLICSSFFC